jgi:hypothetical protein
MTKKDFGSTSFAKAEQQLIKKINNKANFLMWSRYVIGKKKSIIAMNFNKKKPEK